MKKTALVILIATLSIILCLGLTSCAQGENIDGFVVAENADGSYTVIGCTLDAAEIKIPAEIGGKAVTAIGANAFAGNATVTKIVLPDSVTSLGSGAFSGCKLLTTVEGGKYTVIPTGAFAGSEALTTVVLPEGLTEIGYRAFSGCKALKSVELPSTVTDVLNYAFADCEALESFNIAGEALNVYANAFKNCKVLKSISTPDDGPKDAIYKFADGVMFDEAGTTLVSFVLAVETYEIPKNVTAVAPGAFHGNFSLKSITVAEGNESFVALDGVLYSKDKKTLVAYPAGKSGTEFTVPFDVTVLAGCAFSGNPLLTKIVLPNGVTEIGRSAFDSCTALVELDARTVTANVGELAFSGCKSLTTYRISDATKAYKLAVGVLYSTDEANLVSYPANRTDTEFTVPAMVKTIEARAFSLAAALTELKVAEENVRFKAIDGCLYTADGTSLVAVPAKKAGELTVAAEAVKLEIGAFENCAELTKVTLPAGVVEIPENAFAGCAALKELIMQGSVTKIFDGAFAGVTLDKATYKGTEAQWAAAGGTAILPAEKVTFN